MSTLQFTNGELALLMQAVEYYQQTHPATKQDADMAVWLESAREKLAKEFHSRV